MSKPQGELARRLGYQFRDPALLARALTHRSHSADHNERLEFLGDSVLNLVISALLYERYSGLTEGELTRLRASLVNQPALAAHARRLALGEYLRLGEGELKSGGFDRDSILADTLEALFGAIFQEDGLGAARTVVLGLYDETLAQLDPTVVPKDPKTQLQEYLQKRGLPTPAYEVLEVAGEAHHQRFVVSCRVSGLDAPLRGEGSSRRVAEQQAAAQALALLAGARA